MEVPDQTPPPLRPYLHTERAVAFTENHHCVGVDELLYSGLEIVLPGLVLDGRHFGDKLNLPAKASVERWTIRRTPRPLNHSRSLLIGVTISVKKPLERNL